MYKLILNIASISLMFLQANNANCQKRGIIYLFPGQGSDERLFDSLQLDSSFEVKVVHYHLPPKNSTMKSYAVELAKQIDTTNTYYFIGVSMGGMLCIELSEMLKPQKTLIISSAKNLTELPFRYRFQQKVPIYKIIPGKIMLWSAKRLQPIVEPDRNNNKETFKAMLECKSSDYMSRTVSMIINWDRKANTTKIVHIHGTKDHTIPIRNIKHPDINVKNGSHMMTLTRGKELSKIIQESLLIP